MPKVVDVVIPGGSFLMGCEQGRDEEKPVHRATVGAFAMAVHQVTNRDYARFRTPPQAADPNLNHPKQPVVSVSWFEAVAYCDWLNAAVGHGPGLPVYRLPTEAEWERAALGGRDGALWVWGNEPPQSRECYQRRWSGIVTGPRPVGEEQPNPYGLFDLGENVHEWCSDWYARDYYAISPELNPAGPESGERKASRGGSWRHHVKVTRCAARSSIPPGFQYADYGFRIVRTL